MAFPHLRATQTMRDMRGANQPRPRDEGRFWHLAGGRGGGRFAAAGKRSPHRAVNLYPASSSLKRLVDIVAGMALLIALLPVMLIVGTLVKRDGGPLLFRHKRIGANGQMFECLKFRTMCPDAEARLNKLLDSDPEARRSWEKDFKLKVDPRVTPLGQVLRQTSLDELPQLINVIRGDMSLVGPRPIVSAEALRYGPAFRDYLGCRPGLTGVWQVSGRNDVDYETRVRMDTSYARSWSLSWDIVILIRTAGIVFRRTGAY